MPNTYCKPEDVAKCFIECVHTSMAECYPELEKDSPEYNKIAAKLLYGSLGGLMVSW